MTDTPEMLPVTQADIEAATKLVSQLRGYGVTLPNSNHHAIQAFTAHRLTHSTPPALQREDVARVQELAAWGSSLADTDELPGDVNPIWLRETIALALTTTPETARLRSQVERMMEGLRELQSAEALCRYVVVHEALSHTPEQVWTGLRMSGDRARALIAEVEAGECAAKVTDGPKWDVCRNCSDGSNAGITCSYCGGKGHVPFPATPPSKIPTEQALAERVRADCIAAVRSLYPNTYAGKTYEQAALAAINALPLIPNTNRGEK